MRKFESLGKSLTKAEMRLMVGGIYDFETEGRANCLVGWTLDPNQGCLCDWYGVASTHSVTCGVSCPVTLCNSGSIDYSCAYFH